MKKIKTMRFASVLLVLTLLSTCAISGTFAKYTTKAEGTDSARVARWGFTGGDSIVLTDLFKTAYDQNVQSNTGVIAPGTTGSASFSFNYNDTQINAPEVKYTFTISTEGSTIDESIKNNPNILWAVDDKYGTWEDMLKAIASLAGNTNDGDTATGSDNTWTCTGTFGPSELPHGFATTNTTHTVSWKWIFDENAKDKETDTLNNDTGDTAMGNAADLANVTLKITATATQVD